MKKNYLKPEAEYICFNVTEAVTDIIDGEQGFVSGNPDWED